MSPLFYNSLLLVHFFFSILAMRSTIHLPPPPSASDATVHSLAYSLLHTPRQATVSSVGRCVTMATKDSFEVLLEEEVTFQELLNS